MSDQEVNNVNVNVDVHTTDNIVTSSSNLVALLHRAVHDNNIEVVSKLIRERVDVDAIDLDGRTPLQVAVETGHHDIFRLLITSGCADFTKKAADGVSTLLHIAAIHGRYDYLHDLLCIRIDINALDANNNTALHLALLFDHVDCARYLIDYGADMYVANVHEQTPLDVAAAVEGNFWEMLIAKMENNRSDDGQEWWLRRSNVRDPIANTDRPAAIRSDDGQEWWLRSNVRDPIANTDRPAWIGSSGSGSQTWWRRLFNEKE